MQHREIKLLPDLVHLLADDGHDFVKGAVAEKKIGIDSGCQLTNVARPHKKLVAGDFRVCRGFAQGGNKKL